MSNDKAKLLLILSVILVSLLSNKSPTPFYEFEGKGVINHFAALALGSTLHNPSQNNTDVQYITSPIYKTNRSSSDVLALVNNAYSLYSQGNYTQAIRYYDNALTIDPNDKRALDGKGNALYNQGNNKLAIQYYDKALAIDPHYVDAIYDRDTALNRSSSDVSALVELYEANSLLNQGNYSQAILYYDKALAFDPNDKDALNGKGDALYSLANDTQGYEKAIQSYDKALAIDPNDTYALNGKGNTLNSKGNNTQAIHCFDKVLAINPKDSIALNGKGNALSGQGNYTQAIQYYDKALAIDPKDKVILRNKADALFNQVSLYDQGNYTQAMQYYDKATQAIQYYDKALAIDPNYKEALSGKGSALGGIANAFYNQGKYSQSIQYYNKALAIDPKDSSASYGKQNVISKIAESASTSGYSRGCIDAQIPNPSERYINQSKNGTSIHYHAFMQVYNEGFDACSGDLQKRVETLKMFNNIVLNGNVTDETANTRVCTTVSEGGPQTICQNLDNLKPENGSNSIESNVFTFENVPVNASFHSKWKLRYE